MGAVEAQTQTSSPGIRSVLLSCLRLRRRHGSFVRPTTSFTRYVSSTDGDIYFAVHGLIRGMIDGLEHAEWSHMSKRTWVYFP